MFKQVYYTRAILPILQTQVVRPLLECSLFVAKFFLLNGLFIILSFISSCATLLAIMVLINLLSSWSLDGTVAFLRVLTHLLQ